MINERVIMRWIVTKFKGTHCRACLRVFPSPKLECHHVNPDEKHFKINQMVKEKRGIPALKRELNKCVVLCHECHMDEHHLLKQDERHDRY